MSRIAKKPVELPQGVTLEQKNGEVIVKGPKGQLTMLANPAVTIANEDNNITVRRVDDTKNARAQSGTTRALIANMVHGVSQGWQRVLDFVGVGYKAEVQGNKLVLSLGFSHPVEYVLPEGISAKVEKNTALTLEGIDKQKVGMVAAEVRGFRPPEPYKGKGVKYREEVIMRKEGKKK